LIAPINPSPDLLTLPKAELPNRNHQASQTFLFVMINNVMINN
jgi:hypothetical protein